MNQWQEERGNFTEEFIDSLVYGENDSRYNRSKEKANNENGWVSSVAKKRLAMQVFLARDISFCIPVKPMKVSQWNCMEWLTEKSKK